MQTAPWAGRHRSGASTTRRAGNRHGGEDQRFYIGRILRLTLLASEIVESILDGRQPSEMTLAVLMKPFSVGWHDRKRSLLAR